MRRGRSIPGGWRTGVLSDLVFFQRGFDITKAGQHPGDVPVVSSSGIKSYHSEATAAGPGVIIGRKGTLGSIHFSEGPYWAHDTTLWSKDLKGNVPRYVYYFLHTMGLERYDVGNSNPTLNRNHIHGLEVAIPPLTVQHQIAEVLSAYDDLIENNRRRIRLLEQAARLLYKEWFVHLRFPVHEDVKVIDHVPEGWRSGTVADLGSVITGKTPSTKEPGNYGPGIPFVKTPDMHGNPVVIDAAQHLTDQGVRTQANKTIPTGSVLVSCIGTVGVVSLTGCVCQTNQQINAVVPSRRELTHYAFFALHDLKPRLEAMGGGATMANVNKTKFSSLPILIPPSNQLCGFDEVARDAFRQIAILLETIEKLSRARDLLLPRLINGEIAV